MDRGSAGPEPYGDMQSEPRGARLSRRIDLAHVRSFTLGSLEVRPAERLVLAGGESEIVEPRVMQVLVALTRVNGATMSRDDLIESCWDGRIVGENAIHRVVSQVRRLAAGIGRGSFEVETITKVGYRLVANGGTSSSVSGLEGLTTPVQPAGTATPAEALPAEARGKINRRTAFGGAVVLGLAGAAGWWSLKTNQERVPTPESRALYERGMALQYFGAVETIDQSHNYFRQAAEADPQWADAWGSLAMSYRHMLDGETNESQWRLVQLCRSAAARALALDPDNAEAQVALALIRSPYGRWAQAEQEYRALVRRHPRAFVARGHLAGLLASVGRWHDAVDQSTIQLEQQPLIFAVSLRNAFFLWGAERLHETEREIERGRRIWPNHPWIWAQKVEYLTYTGQAGSAIALVEDAGSRPAAIPEAAVRRLALKARAIETRRPQDIAAARSALLENFDVGTVPQLAPFFATIGDHDTGFALSDAYLTGRGPFALPSWRPPGPPTRRNTDFLFMPMTRGMHSDPRFAALLSAIGLEAYWRSTHTQPDYRQPRQA